MTKKHMLPAPLVAGVRGGEDEHEARPVPQEVLRVLQVQVAARLLQLHRGPRRRHLLQGLLPTLLGTRYVLTSETFIIQR